jgi:drug/metabolite transporter (DMT)-like permease
MLEFLPSLGSLLSYGSVSAFSKKAIGIVGRHKAIAYAYAALVTLLLIGAIALGMEFRFPAELIPAYVAQIALGGLGAIAIYKALDYGKATLTNPISKTYVLLVLATSVIFLGEELTPGQIGGSVLIVASAFVLTKGSGEWKSNRWLIFIGMAIICRTYYYTFIKAFVLELGPYMATLSLELGVAAFVVAFHLLRGRDLSPPPADKAWFPLAAGTLIFAGSLLYSLSVSLVGAALTAAISAASPIVNAVASYLLLKERLEPHKYAAIALMVAGLAMIFLL